MAVSTQGPRPYAPTGPYVCGATGLKLRDQRVRRLAQRMHTVRPWLEDSAIPSFRAWAELEVLATKLYAWLRDHGLLNA